MRRRPRRWRESSACGVRDERGAHRAPGRRRGGDLLEHRHARRPARCRAASPASRSSARSRSLDLAEVERGAGRWPRPAAVAARLQPPLRPGHASVREAVASGEIGDVQLRPDHVPRPGAAAARLHGALRRAVPRHDDPRLRHGALRARRGGRRSTRSARCSSTRRSAAAATSTPRRSRSSPRPADRPDRQQPPGDLRVRPADRGVRLGRGMASGNRQSSTARR